MKTIPPLIEVLETRIAPAVATLHLISAHAATYTDVDGDLVTVTITHGTLTAGDFIGVPSQTGLGDQLQTLVLTDAGFTGTDVTFAVKKKPSGDGLVNVGYIDAIGRDLGKVTVPGDLAHIDAGQNDGSTALAALTVHSMQIFGDSTQVTGSNGSEIRGALGTLSIAADAGSVQMQIYDKVGSVKIGGSLAGSITSSGQLGPVMIGGNMGDGLLSGDTVTSVTIGGSVFGGEIAGNTIGAVKIGGDLVANGEEDSGKIDANGDLASVTIGGSIIGKAGAENGSISPGNIVNSGQIFALDNLGPVKIGHDVLGGDGADSGKIVAHGQLVSLTIGGSLIGGTGSDEGGNNDDGQIFAFNGIGPVMIGHDVVGGSGPSSGLMQSGDGLATVSVGGSILGGTGDFAGGIEAERADALITVSHDVQGGAGVNSGSIQVSGHAMGITIGGALLGGSNNSAGSVSSHDSIDKVSVGHDVQGSSGVSSGSITNAVSVAIGGSLIGGSQGFAGEITGGVMKTVTIGHNLLGGSASETGFLYATTSLQSVTIGGSLVGGTANATGLVAVDGDLGSITLGHNLIGGSATGSTALDNSGSVLALGRIGSVTIGGSIVAGYDTSSAAITNGASIRAGNDIGSLTVKGDIIGHGDLGNGASLVVISARGVVQQSLGAETDLTIGHITVGGRVEEAHIMAGYRPDTSSSPALLVPANGDAQIGPVKIGGDWIASDLVAGAVNYGADGMANTSDDNVNFGNANDHKITGGTDSPNIVSAIASITISGQVFGTPNSINSADSFGFVTEQLGPVKIGSRTFNLKSGPDNDGRAVSATGDAALHEVGALFGGTANVPPPAILVSPTTISYTDVDDDRVLVTLSKPLLTAANVNSVFKFNVNQVNDGQHSEQQLELINLGVLATNGLGVTVTVAPGVGDGLANVGAITDGGFDLGSITIPGDLGQITGGSNTAGHLALGALKVRTIGRLGLDTQPASGGGFTRALGATINGDAGSIAVQQDVIGASFSVSGAVGSLTLGGSLVGATAVNSAFIFAKSFGVVKIGQNIEGGSAEDAGLVQSAGGIGALTVGGSLIGGSGLASGSVVVVSAPGASMKAGSAKIGQDLVGGLGANTGKLATGAQSGPLLAIGQLGSIAIGGSILGGAGTSSGGITSTGAIGTVSVLGDVVGGSGGKSGIIHSAQQLGAVTIHGALVGGSAANAGEIQSADNMGAVSIGQDFLGGTGMPSGDIISSGTLAGVTVGGSVVGGLGDTSAYIDSFGTMGAGKIGGNVLGGAGQNSGLIQAGDSTVDPPVSSPILSFTVGGSMRGGSGAGGGTISTAGGLGPVSVKSNVLGGTASGAGIIGADGKMSTISIGGTMLGGTAVNTGDIATGGSIGLITIGGNLLGGSGDSSGVISGEGKLAGATIRGSIVGADFAGSTSLVASGAITISGDVGAVTVGGNLLGGSVSGTGGSFNTGYIDGNSNIAVITIGGSIVAGQDSSTQVDLVGSGSIQVAESLGNLTVKGSLLGNSMPDGLSRVVISAGGAGATTGPDYAFHQIAIAGSSDFANILGGYDINLTALANTAQIGTVKIGKDWVASNLVVGVENLGADDAVGGTGANADNVNFGDANDRSFGQPPAAGHIASIVIGGTVAGTDTAGDHFGFSAVSFGAFKFAGFTAPAQPPISLLELSPSTMDVTVHVS